MSGLLVESREVRRIIGQLVSGEALLPSLLATCDARRVRAATIQLGGVLKSVSLVHHDVATRALGTPRKISSPMQILAGSGLLSEREGKPELRVQLVLSRESDNGIEVIGGVVTEATVLGCEYVIEAMDDVLLRRQIDRRTGLATWFDLVGKDYASAPPAAAPAAAAPEPVPVPGPSAEPDPSETSQPSVPAVAVAAGASLADRWAVATAASAAAQAEPAPPPAAETKKGPPPVIEPYKPMRAGDIIEHNKFGRCVIEKVDADEEFATVRLRNKRLVRLNIDVLDLRYLHDEEDKQVFGQ